MGYDALILVSFGGPEGPHDVLPFLRNVVRGRGVPDERLAAVAEHYYHFDGVSPINAQCRELLAALRIDLAEAGVDLPLYWGNRNWHPLLADTLAQMRDDGVRRALAFVTSPFGSYSSCRQYLDDFESARAAVGSAAPVLDKIRHYHDHPGYVLPHADAVRQALRDLSDVEPVRLVFTAHSIPSTMESQSGPAGGRYSSQLRETAKLVAEEAGPGRADGASGDRMAWDLVWQSRSGPPQVPWLEPDINDHLATLADAGVKGVVVSPIGFISDHLEVVWDLDTEAAETARKLGLRYQRARTPGTDPRFVSMVRDLFLERLDMDRGARSGTGFAGEGEKVARNSAMPRARLGTLPIWDTCPTDCCRPRT